MNPQTQLTHPLKVDPGSQPAAAPKLACTVPNHAFTPTAPPRIDLTFRVGHAASKDIALTLVDLLNNEAWPLAADVLEPTDRPGRWVVKPSVPFGVYRLTAESPNAESDDLCFAYAPAESPADLPEDWPLATHVTERRPHPLPGFKWYRLFSHWSRNNPRPGRYDWSRLDPIYRNIKAAGGKLEIADDGVPVWASSRGKAEMDWMPEATAYPPDDWRPLRAYLHRLVDRYDDSSGTLGSLEVWNEANTYQRFLGRPRDLVEMARIYKEAASSASRPIEIVGIALSAGHHPQYVHDLIDAGILDNVDAISGHFYEEMHCYDRQCPINNLPLHAQLLREPMHRAGYDLPIYNSECGIEAAPREAGRIISQTELNRRAESDPAFDPTQPWMSGNAWRQVSEYRGAAEFIAGITMLMAEGISRTYSYLAQSWMIDDAPSLYWVATSVFGQHLRDVNYRCVAPVKADVEASDDRLRVLAYRIGDPSDQSLIVAWLYEVDTEIGRSKLWQPWLDPTPVRMHVNGDAIVLTDLYDRHREVCPVQGGEVTVPVGEQPVYLLENYPSR
jgi:hypothetical protein